MITALTNQVSGELERRSELLRLATIETLARRARGSSP